MNVCSLSTYISFKVGCNETFPVGSAVAALLSLFDGLHKEADPGCRLGCLQYTRPSMGQLYKKGFSIHWPSYEWEGTGREAGEHGRVEHESQSIGKEEAVNTSRWNVWHGGEGMFKLHHLHTLHTQHTTTQQNTSFMDIGARAATNVCICTIRKPVQALPYF